MAYWYPGICCFFASSSTHSSIIHVAIPLHHRPRQTIHHPQSPAQLVTAPYRNLSLYKQNKAHPH